MNCDKNVFKLKEVADIENYIWNFRGSGLLFNYINPINEKLSELKDNAYIEKSSSNQDVINVFFKINPAPDLTLESIRSKKKEFLEYFEKVGDEIVNGN
ncbi:MULTISPECIES: hypothetical protein [Methanobacterium]|uniref:Uncharacterized protein n=1 Tax=Methanobacterium bryantii TaxID=2161 RepID=A0A2A2H7F4_METBR|nr:MULTISPECIES: hypothetical protein [Methanobacterium]OEC85116.1 hypothetical protein A9507_14395 [Methanobacterium sp. A39]PAV05266.1 hypothetical protein ASJ80_09970 [Methanobacterium bryantii]